MIELALPAGSLENALCAFSSGADAVYFGMKDFSARKGAVNFSTEDLSKIRRFAQDNGKNIYVTVNTLVDDGEIAAASTLLSALDFYQPDGLIIQDLGLVEIVRRHYPACRCMRRHSLRSILQEESENSRTWALSASSFPANSHWMRYGR